jgi:hypothetical protein
LSGHTVPSFAVADKTLVFDTANNAQVMWLEGKITLPVGTEIELHSDTAPHAGTATVTGTRLMPGNATAATMLCLTVSVTDGWEKHYEAN